MRKVHGDELTAGMIVHDENGPETFVVTRVCKVMTATSLLDVAEVHGDGSITAPSARLVIHEEQYHHLND